MYQSTPSLKSTIKKAAPSEPQMKSLPNGHTSKPKTNQTTKPRIASTNNPGEYYSLQNKNNPYNVPSTEIKQVPGADYRVKTHSNKDENSILSPSTYYTYSQTMRKTKDGTHSADGSSKKTPQVFRRKWNGSSCKSNSQKSRSTSRSVSKG